MISRLATIAEKFIRVFTVRSVRLGRILERRQRVIQIAAAAVAIGLGLWGWTINKPPANLSNWFDNIFRTAQLVTLQFPADLYDSIPWQLQVARLLVPLVAILATINVLVGAITRPIRLALMPYVKGHVVLCGTAQLNEAALHTLAERGRRIVTVAPVSDPARCESLDALGITLVEADPFQSVTFRALNIAEASALFLTLAWISTDWNPSNAGFGKGFRRLRISALSVIRYGELITRVHAVSFASATILGESGTPRFRCIDLRRMPAFMAIAGFVVQFEVDTRYGE